MSSPFALPDGAATMSSMLSLDLDVVVAATSALLALSTVAVALRIFIRSCLATTFGVDDVLILGAFVTYVVTAGLTFVSVYAERILIQTGTLIYPTGVMVQLIHYVNASYTLTMVLAKLSMGLFFFKVFAKDKDCRRQCTFATTLVLVSIVTGVIYLLMTFTCPIISDDGSCWCAIQAVCSKMGLASSILNGISDYAMALLGCHILWKAKLSGAAKVAAESLLIFSCVGIMASLARVAIQLPVPGVEISGILLVKWSNIEAGICVIVASLIALPPMLQLSRQSVQDEQSLTAGSRDVKYALQEDAGGLEKGQQAVLSPTDLLD